MRKFSFFLLLIGLFQSVSCSKIDNTAALNEHTANAKGNTRAGFEISYWIDMDLRSNNGRGYWVNVSDEPANENVVPTSYEIWAAVSRCRYTYHALSLYVIYHRQFEPETAKQVFAYWKQHGDQMGVKIIPVVVLQDYKPNSERMNFTDTEIYDFARWCSSHINHQEFGVYDIFPNRQMPGTDQDAQLSIINTSISVKYNTKIVRLGLQPERPLPDTTPEPINPHITRAVVDTWGAECEGRTNSYWEYPVSYKGTTDYGRNKLVRWINERNLTDTKKITWNLIPVAWDYNKLIDTDPYGYDFPGDNGLTNMSPSPGRLVLSHGYIVNAYTGGSSNPKFGGYSCDLRILQLNSANRSESPNFYESIRSDNEYNGIFKPALTEIASIYDLYDN